MAAEIIVNAGKSDWAGFDEVALTAVRQNLAAKTHDDPDFWSVTSRVDLRVYEAIAKRALAGELAEIEAAYEDVHSRVSAAWLWASVRDQLKFVLPAYADAAKPAEKKAVADLLEHLDGMAKGGRHPHAG